MKIENIGYVPNSHQGMKLKYPWNKMNIGDGFTINCQESDMVNKRSTLLNAAKSYAKLNDPSMKFVTRRTDNGISIWRVE